MMFVPRAYSQPIPRTIAARHSPAGQVTSSPLSVELVADPFSAEMLTSVSKSDQPINPLTNHPFDVSSPLVSQLFNIFHPSDPISYRMEPLISPAMKTLKPHPLPYTKKSILGTIGQQSITGIAQNVGQSVSGLWSSLSAGIASSMLNRTLGLSSADVANMSHAPAAVRTGGRVAAGDAEAPPPVDSTAEGMGNDAPPASTLVEEREIETLFSQFENSRRNTKPSSDGDADDGTSTHNATGDARAAARVRREEHKVRALNHNGRVDYCIQEGALDFNPITTIASHMSYWADEDVNHFILTQLLSRRPRQPDGPSVS